MTLKLASAGEPGVQRRSDSHDRSSTLLPRPSRRVLARTRAQAAWEQLGHCRLCAHACGVDRLHGERGLCHAGSGARCFHAQTEVSDESELAPVFAVALSGCDLRCDFCNTGRESWDPQAGEVLTESAQELPALDRLAQRAHQALSAGARSVMILGGEPTIHLPTALGLAARMPEDAKLVWKTNAHGTAVARDLLQGVFDVWVADYKFGQDECAARLAKVPHYTETVRENLCWAAANTDLIVRHLLMPGHLECCWAPIAHWLSRAVPGVKVSLRRGFWPGWQSRRHPELRSTTSVDEERRALDLAHELHLNLIS